MPLQGYQGRDSGWLQGINNGLSNLVAIKGMQNENLRNDRADRAEARTKVIQGREDAAYTEANTVSPFKTNPEHGPEVHSYLLNYGANLGLIDENGNIKNASKVKLREVLAKDENAQHDILQLQRRKLTGEISALEQSLGGRPSDDLTGLAAETNKQLQEKKARLDNLNYTDKAWVAEQAAKRQKQKDTDEQTNKEKGLEIQQTQANTQSQTAKDTKDYQSRSLEIQAENQKRDDENRAEQLKIARKTLEETTGARLRDDQMKILAAVSPKAKRTVTDEAGNVTVIETPDLVKGMESARKLRPDLFKDVPVPPKENINWNLVWPKLEENLKADPSKAAAVAAKLQEEFKDQNIGEMLAGPLFKDKPNLVKAMKPYFPVTRGEQKQNPEAAAKPKTGYERKGSGGGLTGYEAEAKRATEERRLERERADELQRQKNAERQNRRAARMPWERQ